jgi:predicted DNA binding CopG/RHH family protein
MKKEYDLKKLKKRPGKTPVDPDSSHIKVELTLDARDFAMLKTEAVELGIPFMTLISSIFHQYSRGDLIPKKTVEMLKKLRA